MKANLKELALDEIMDIVFDTAAEQPDEKGKLNQIEGVLSFMMRLEDADDDTFYLLTDPEEDER